MHKGIKKLQTGGTSTYKPKLFSALSLDNNLKSLLSGFSQIGGNSMSNMPTGINDSVVGTTPAEIANAQIGKGLSKALSGFMQFSDINNSGMNSTQKNMARADAGLGVISDAASFIPGIGGVIGGSLNAINKIGGSLIGTPKVIKDYVVNDAVASSSAYSGIANDASEAARSAESYKGAGLVGKLFGKGKVKNDITKSNEMQNRVSGLLKDNAMAFDRSASSSDLFATNNKNKIYGTNSYMNGSVQYGKDGAKINFKSLVKQVHREKANSIKTEEVAPEVIKSHENGGTINVIVEGKLHAHKHDLKKIDKFKDAEITEKGVAVVTLSEGGEVVTQHAEVERDELVLHKDLTETLEKLFSKGTTKSTILAGKIMAEEIVNNTRDSKSKIIKNA